MKMLSFVFIAALALAQEHGHPLYFDQLDQQVKSKQITQEQALLEKFTYAFSKQSKKADDVIKCFTPQLREYRSQRGNLSAATIEFIESKLNRFKKKAAFTFNSPSGLFTINYDTIGGDSVSTIDLNNNAIPDYVENVADYFDFSFTAQVTNGSYRNPIQSGKTYQVFLENLGLGFYGYADNDNFGSTYITIHNTFIGFPANTDSESQELGAAKVTAAHEFKHAIQFATDLIQWDNLIESWLELDATWAEEFVYDGVNDYYNYLLSNSCQISNPAVRMNNNNNSGDYFDVIWNLYLTQSHGNQILNQFWDRRSLQNGESVLTTYEAIIVQNGSSMNRAIREYTSWNYMSGSRATAQYGYEEAAFYPTSPLQDDIDSKSNITFSGTISPFASHHYTLSVSDNSYATIQLDGDPNLELMILIENLAGFVTSYRLSGNAQRTINISLDKINNFGIVPVGAVTNGSALSYNFNLSYTDSPDFGSSFFVIEKSSIKGKLELNHNLIAASDKTAYEIYNLLGQKISSGRLTLNSIATEISFPRNLARGIYFIRVQLNNQIDTQRFTSF